MFLQELGCWLGRRSHLRFGLRDRIIRLIENPDATRGYEYKQICNAGYYTGNTSNFIDWSARYYGWYSKGELDLFSDCLTSIQQNKHGKPFVLDIGANVGNHTLYFALEGGVAGIAFEPNPVVRQLIQEKLIANQVTNWSIDSHALSDHAGSMDLWLPDSNNLGICSLESKVGTRCLQVDVVEGDRHERISKQPRIDYIKIDVEGHELAVLRGLAQTIDKHSPYCFFEWNSQTRFALATRIFPSCYRFYRFSCDNPVALFFNDPVYRLMPVSRDQDLASCNVLAAPGPELEGNFLPHLRQP